jgi:hypothetical protein
LQDVIDAYAAQNIQLEGIMNDLDYLEVNRDSTNNPGHYDLAEGKAFLDKLHANGQYYLDGVSLVQEATKNVKVRSHITNIRSSLDLSD